MPEILTAAVAAVVALLGYLINQHAARRERKAKLYAEALSALNKLQELPYRIYRRTSDEADVRQHLADVTRATQEAVSYYDLLLQLDAAQVSRAYSELVRKTRLRGVELRAEAWRESPLTSAAAMASRVIYDHQNERELRACVVAMRQELAATLAAVRRRNSWDPID